MEPMDQLVMWEKRDVLDTGFCQHVMDKFDKDHNKHDGYISSGVVDKNIKSSIDLNISGYPEWTEENEEFQARLRDVMHEYREYLSAINPRLIPVSNRIKDSGFQVQRTSPGGGYTWHSDVHAYTENGGDVFLTNVRCLTYIFYLNTIADFDGGYTEFIDGTKVTADRSKVLLFPSTWNYVHRGFPPKVTKYIATGWIYDVIKTPIHNGLQTVPPAETRNMFIKAPIK